MKKRILLFTLVAGLGSLVISSYHLGPASYGGFDCTGAESAGTGAFANPTGCSSPGISCHSTSATTSIVVAIELDSAGVPTTHYKAGLSYTVKITGTPTGTTNTKYGFQLTALKGTASTTSNVDAGTWSGSGLPAGSQKSAPTSGTKLTCMEHNNTQTLSGSSFSKSFSWTAPTSGTGPISFWSAINFVNGNTGADAGDVWNTNHITINEWPVINAVSTETLAFGVKAFPNPVTNNLNLQFEHAQPSTYAIQVFNITGRTMASETIDINSVSQKSLNTGNWPAGLYQVVIEKDGNRQVISVVK